MFLLSLPVYYTLLYYIISYFDLLYTLYTCKEITNLFLERNFVNLNKEQKRQRLINFEKSVIFRRETRTKKMNPQGPNNIGLQTISFIPFDLQSLFSSVFPSTHSFLSSYFTVFSTHYCVPGKCVFVEQNINSSSTLVLLN